MLAEELATPTRSVSVGRDEEHNVFFLDVEDRTGGNRRRYRVGVDVRNVCRVSRAVGKLSG